MSREGGAAGRTGDPDLENVLELLAVPGAPGEEAAVSGLVRGKLLEMGVPADCITGDGAHRKSEIGGQTGNLIVRLEGRGRGERRMLSTHLDTVPGAVGCRPRLDGGRVLNDAPGRCLGADARAGCAVLLAAARTLLALDGDHPPWTLVFFVQEEIGLVGARWLEVPLLGEPRPAMCFNFDGADVREVTYRVIGTERLHVTVTGVASHTMYPEAGISAAEIAARAAAEAMEAGWHGKIEKPEGRGLANLGVLRGGTGSNVIMPELYALLEARSYDRGFRSKIIEAWKEALARAVERANSRAGKAGGRAEVSFRPGPVYDPYELPGDAPVLRAATGALRRIGIEPELVADDGGQDAAWIVAHGIPAVGMAFGGRRAHTSEEWLDLGEFKRACRLAAELVNPQDTGDSP